MKLKFHLTILIVIFIYSHSYSRQDIQINGGKVKINGFIESHNKNNKTGQLSYFDAITRIIYSKEFDIDSLGNFNISFFLLHPIIGSFYINLESYDYSDIYIEPNKDYNIKFKNNDIFIKGKDVEVATEILNFKKIFKNNLSDLLKKADNIQNEEKDIEKLTVFYKQAEKIEIDYLNSYRKSNKISSTANRIIKDQIHYGIAHKLVLSSFEFKPSLGYHQLRDSLPKDFFHKIRNDYEIISLENCDSRECMDYISILRLAFASMGKTIESRIKFLQSSPMFSQDEKVVNIKLWKGQIAETSQEFQSFYQYKENKSRLSAFFNHYELNLLLRNISQLSPDLCRDLIISQGVSHSCFSNDILPDENEWRTIDSLLINKSIYRYLKSLSNNTTKERGNSNEQENDTSFLNVKKKYIDKYLGKVIYIDVYATWCGPCREEIPYAKVLHNEFKNKDVVFLNLCAESNEETWKKLIEHNNIKGENFLLTNAEYKSLSRLYRINGYPTFILIDKNGNVVNSEAPRPSEKKINDIIDGLLKE